MPAATEADNVSFNVTVNHDGGYVVARAWRLRRTLQEHYRRLYGEHQSGLTVSTYASIQYARELWQQLVDGSTPYDEKLFWGVLSAMNGNGSVDFGLEQNLPGLFTLLRRNFGLRQVVLSALGLQREPQSLSVKKSMAETVEVRVPLRKSASTGELRQRLITRPGLAETIGKEKLAEIEDDFLVGLFHYCPTSAYAQGNPILQYKVLSDPRLADVVLTNDKLREKVVLNSGDICVLIKQVSLINDSFKADECFVRLFSQVLPFYSDVLNSSNLLKMASGGASPQQGQSTTKAVDKIKEYFYGTVVQNGKVRFKPKSFTCRLDLIDCLLEQPQLFVALAGAGTPPAHLMDLLNLAFDSPNTLLSFVKSLSEKTQTRNFILDNIGHIVVNLERLGFPRKNLNALLRTKVADGCRNVKLGGQLRQWICSGNNGVLLEQLISNDYVRGKVNLSAEECLGVLKRIGSSEDDLKARQKTLSLVMLADSNLLNKLGSYRERHNGAVLSSAIYYCDARQVVQEHLTDIMRGNLGSISVNGEINQNCALVIASDPHLWARITSRRRGWFGFKENIEQWSTRVRVFKDCSPIFQKKRELDNDGQRHSVLGACKLLVEHANSLPGRVAASSPIRGSSPAPVPAPVSEGASSFVPLPVAEGSVPLPGGSYQVLGQTPATPAPAGPTLASTARILGSMSNNVAELSRNADLQALSHENFADMVKKYEDDPEFLQTVVRTTAIFQKIARDGNMVACGRKFLSVVFNGDITAFSCSSLLGKCHDDVCNAIVQSYEAAQKEEKLIRSRPDDLLRLLSFGLEEELTNRRANDLDFWVNAVANPKLFSTIGKDGITQFVQKILLGKPIEFVVSIFKSCHIDSLENLIGQHTKESEGCGPAQLVDFWTHVMQKNPALRDKIGVQRFITSVLFGINEKQIVAILSTSERNFFNTVCRTVMGFFKDRTSLMGKDKQEQIRSALLEVKNKISADGSSYCPAVVQPA